MSIGLAAFHHHPAPERAESFAGRRQVTDAGRTQPCVPRTQVWATPEGNTAATGAPQSKEASRASAEADREPDATNDGSSDREVAHVVPSR